MTTPRLPTLVAIALGACLLAGAAGCGSGDGGGRASAEGQVADTGAVTVVDATVEKPLNPKTAAVRMVIENGTARDDTLESVTSSVSGGATVHRSETDAEGRSVMTAEESLPIRARSSVTFEPGGLHVMLTDISEPLEVGDDVQLTLEFEHAGTVTATASVVALGSTGDDSEGTHDDH